MNNLEQLLINQTREVLLDLFNRAESFYYIVFFISGGIPNPMISAWSIEALNREIKKKNIPQNDIDSIRWSYADSPYLDFGSSKFDEVKNILNKRGNLYQMNEEASDLEYDFRVSLLTNTFEFLNKEGFFSKFQKRTSLMINVEEVPPTFENTERALLLNPKESLPLKEWLISCNEQD